MKLDIFLDPNNIDPVPFLLINSKTIVHLDLPKSSGLPEIFKHMIIKNDGVYFLDIPEEITSEEMHDFNVWKSKNKVQNITPEYMLKHYPRFSEKRALV